MPGPRRLRSPVGEEPRAADARATPFDPLTDQFDRAQAVENTVEQRKRDLDDAIEQSEQRDERS